MNFEKGNELYRQGAYEQAASCYMKAIKQHSELKPICVNFALSIRKIKNAELSNFFLEEAFSLLYPNKTNEHLLAIKKSKLLNAKWYKTEHVVWLPDGVDPLLHYVVVGWHLGLSPSKRFDSNLYVQNHANEMKPHENPLSHYLLKGKSRSQAMQQPDPRNISAESSMSNLAIQVWNGHPISALKALEALYQDKTNSDASRWWAMWHAARWRYFCGDIEESLEMARQMEQFTGVNHNRKETVYLKYFCLLNLGKPQEAYQVLKAFVQMHPADADAQFALANAAGNDKQRLKLINQAFAVHGFSGVRLKDTKKPLSISNVEGMPAAKVQGSLKVSIVMPIYSAGEQVRIAIESLLAQTYQHIEIIAVDDCSPDNTFDVLKALEKEDPRVRAVQPPENGGAYAARNYGLTFATGDLLTTHDSDDWSHPQKIATQVAYLELYPAIKGCSAHWIRTHDNLAFTQNWRPNSSLIHWSHSSFMFRREVFETIGEWDHVRIGGDTEYIWRMQAKFGKKSFAKIHNDTPLAFALDEESSLTRTKATHVRTVYFGLRHIYREICAWWHANHPELHVTNAKAKRAFPAPRSMFERSEGPLVFDSVVAGDFSRKEDCQQAAWWVSQYPHHKIALFHWPSFHKHPEPLCHLYFECLLEGNVEPIVMGQTVQAKIHVITEQDLLNYPLDGYPDLVGLEAWKPL